MQCVSPMLRIVDKEDLENVKIISPKMVQKRLNQNNNYLRDSTKIIDWYSEQYEITEIPCGKCYACRLTYSAEWATRIMLEKENYPDHECWFITLTYDDNNLNIPKSMTFDYNDTKKWGSEAKYMPKEHIEFRNDGTWNGTLEPEELQKFIKRVRKHFPNKKIVYFGCGEYGSQTLRPHYHLIMLGTPFKPSEFYDHHVDPKFHKMHNKSRELDKLWKKGMHDMAQVEWSNCSYVARYCMKKVGESWSPIEWAKLGKIPEFVRMSRGIAFDYYEKNKEKIWQTDNITMKTVKGNIGSTKPPKAFMRKLENENPDLAADIKRQRKIISEKITEENRKQSDYTDIEKLIINADKISKKAKMLKREL